MSCILACSGEPGPQGFRGERGPAGAKGKLHGYDLRLIYVSLGWSVQLNKINQLYRGQLLKHTHNLIPVYFLLGDRGLQGPQGIKGLYL